MYSVSSLTMDEINRPLNGTETWILSQNLKAVKSLGLRAVVNQLQSNGYHRVALSLLKTYRPAEMTVKARVQMPKRGKLGGWISMVYYPIAPSQGYTIEGEGEWQNIESALLESHDRIARAQLTQQAE